MKRMTFLALLFGYFYLLLYVLWEHTMTILLSILCTFSFSIIFYEDYAEKHKWSCLKVLKKEKLSFLTITAGMSLPFSLIVGGLHGYFFSGFIAVVTGFINGVILMYSVHKKIINPSIVQIIILIGFIAFFAFISLIWWQF